MAPRSSTSSRPLSSCAMSSPSAVAATITKSQGSKQVEYDRAQDADKAEAEREYSVADSGGGRGCPGRSDVGPYYAGGLVFTLLCEYSPYCVEKLFGK